jgi:hypothetical protein
VRHRIGSAAVVIALAMANMAVSCKGSELQRPLQTSKIATGPNTLESTRRALQGTWTLASLAILDADGRSTSVDAAGTLTFGDAYGNLDIAYQFGTAGLQTLAAHHIVPVASAISTTGRVVIDVDAHRITYVADRTGRTPTHGDTTGTVNPFAIDKPRYYAIGDDGALTLTTKDEAGRDTTTSRWTKRANVDATAHD